MESTLDNKIINESIFPLRVHEKKGVKYLACPYEAQPSDKLNISYLNDNPQIVHFEVSPEAFKRHFLYSKFGDEHIVTMSGYIFEGPVNVYSWKVKNGECIESSDQSQIDLLSNISMYHMEGDDDGKTAGLERAVEKHEERTKDLSLDDVTLDFALSVYGAMVNHVPRR